MKRAYLAIREQPHYRHDAFVAGLQAAGYHVNKHLPSGPPGPGDVLVMWNRYSCNETTADQWEAKGGAVLVAENGYCGRDAKGHQLYAIAVHGHNGSGTWPIGGPERWQQLGIELRPWREAGAHILVCPNRHFGMKGLAMPTDWTPATLKALRQVTKRPIRVRPHPQDSKPERTLAEDLTGAWACVIWASSAGVQALYSGIPVIALSPWWICKAAAGDSLARIENPHMSERAPVFERLAWAQWTVDEISRGEPFRRLLSDTRETEGAAAV
jgi:hypothetical protein